ncbi:MAG: N-acetylmuramoyl-L-alanine amidase [Ruminococcus sp.]|nr:N-acetylmuramoyl-L-alanine amidase [Ruminococcus sp.]
MPTVFLSPSVQEYNPYVDGGNEEYYMNLIADAMEPYLEASGINFVRNNPMSSAQQAIADSNSGDYQLHLAIHSNAAPTETKGKLRGTDIYYFPTSISSKRFAEIIEENFKAIYPNPEKVRIVPTTSLGEVSKTKAPAVLIEVAYHDNRQDAQWIRDNIGNIARVLSYSIAEYFDAPFVEPN